MNTRLRTLALPTAISLCLLLLLLGGSALGQSSLRHGTAKHNANLRSGPGTTYAIAGSVKAGQPLTFTKAFTDWFQLDAGTWVAAFLVQLTTTTPSPTTTVATFTPTVQSTPTKRASTPTKTPTPIRSTPTATSTAVKLFTSGGLGLDKASFEKTYKATGKDIMGVIYDSKLIVAFQNDRVGYIEQQWSDADSATIKAWSKMLIPADATLVETYSPDGRPETTVMLYMSKSMKDRFDSWIGGEPGNFTVQYNTYDGRVTRSIIAVGNNP